jgi:hypothetical protein
MAPIYDPWVTSRWAERVRSSPYYPALRHPVVPQGAARHGAGLVIVNAVLRAGTLGLITAAALLLARRAG